MKAKYFSWQDFLFAKESANSSFMLVGTPFLYPYKIYFWCNVGLQCLIKVKRLTSLIIEFLEI